MATATRKVTLNASRDIPFNKLVLSQSNVRRVKAGISIEQLAEDIAHRSLLQSLNVRPILDAVADLIRRIHADFTFDPQATTVTTPLRDVLSLRRGVCQDFARLGIACLRSQGLAARYVSGYLETVPAPGATCFHRRRTSRWRGGATTLTSAPFAASSWVVGGTHCT